jgi:NtrC-family two-component system response regulator AlgB
MLAELIHKWSQRREQPFVTVNCAVLQESLLESDLFGHVRGAFTGAVKDKPGKLEVADSGTVFLDEIAEMTPAVQTKLLHFLQHREFERVGDVKPRQVDVRVIAATNRDLEEMLADGSFRSDLYYRLNVVELSLPPLRERPEDIELIAADHLQRFARIHNKPAENFDPEAMRLLQNYRWPGNIRELVNLVERCAILSAGGQITSADLPDHILNSVQGKTSPSPFPTLAELERDHIRKVLASTASLEEAAQTLGIDPTTLWRKRKRLGLE